MRALVIIMALLAAAPAAANVLVTDLSKDQISIRSNFSGEKLLLFGAIDTAPHGPVDGIVVVLRGPGENVQLRKKARRFGIWVNGAAAELGPLPGFYAVVGSAPAEALTADEERRHLQIGADMLSANSLNGPLDGAAQAEVLAAFIRLKQAAQLYAEDAGGVEIINDRLFRAEIDLPAGMPVGRYVTEFFAFKNGRLVGYQTGELPVDIVGTGHILHAAAHEASLLYGLSGVAMAMLMGWGVAILFRRQ